MDYLSISQLAQFSGVKAHTIRIWEQRYQALKPNRTEGNTRTYSSLELKRLLNIVTLMDSGHKVSDLGVMNDGQLNQLITEIYELDQTQNANQYVSQLIAAGMQFDEEEFQDVLSFCMDKLGVFQTYTEVISNLLNRVGLMWTVDLLPPAQEHFISNLICQKISAATDALPFPKKDSKKYLLFLPEDEHHEIGLLFTNYVLKSKEFQVIYLGANVPMHTLESVINDVKPDFLFLFFIRQNLPENTAAYLQSLRSIFTDGMIYISGNQKIIKQLELDEKTHGLTDVESLLQLISNKN